MSYSLYEHILGANVFPAGPIQELRRVNPELDFDRMVRSLTELAERSIGPRSR